MTEQGETEYNGIKCTVSIVNTFHAMCTFKYIGGIESVDNKCLLYMWNDNQMEYPL